MNPATQHTPAPSHEELETMPAEELIAWADRRFDGRVAVTTSFGIQSAVTLHLASSVRPDIPVVWIDTGYLPDETYRYADELASRLSLDLRVYRAELGPEDMERRFGRLWETGRVEDLDLYDWVRKVEPLRRAMEDLRPEAWVTGVRAAQTDHRRSMARVAPDGERWKLAPILHWSSRDVYRYMERHALPQHPLWERGYTTVGDWHSSRPLAAGETDERATRFGGLKQECGIHA